MGNNFVNIKNKNVRARWIKSILLGLAFGLLGGGVALALAKLKILPIEQIWALPIGVGCALLAWLATWLLLRRTDKAIAKKLDRKFGLSERVQTMLEYEKAEGAMYELQRVDAEANLASIPKKKLRIKRVWIYAVAFILGVATFAGSIVIKPKADTSGGGSSLTGFTLTVSQRVDLASLINYVKNSDMQSPYRENVVIAIETLRDDLETVTLQTQMENKLDGTLDEILNIMDDSSWVIELTETLWASGNVQVKELAKALNSYDWEKGKEQSMLKSEMTAFTYAFKHEDTLDTSENQEPLDGGKIVSETAAAITKASEALSASLQAYMDLRGEQDGLFNAVTKVNTYESFGLIALGEELTALGGDGTLEDYNNLYEWATKFPKLIDGVWLAIYDELASQQTNITVGEYAVKELCRIFSYDRPRFDKPNLADIQTGGDEGDDGQNVERPPLPDTEVKYGSKEWILNPVDNEQVLYGEIFGSYENDALDKARDENNSYTEEERKAIERYFEILKEGFKEKGDSNE